MPERKKLNRSMSKRKQVILEKGFEMFSAGSIDAVTMDDVAAASGHGIATLYRYFDKKSGFVLAVAEWKWNGFFKENRKRRPTEEFEGKTAADMFDFYLDSFLELYRKEKALLRFNQFFNIYIRSGDVPPESMQRYRELMLPVTGFFHILYERARQDGTVRTDVSETEILSTTVHLMLAAVTRYAVGLVYQPVEGFDAERELETLKRMLYREYITH